MTATPTAIPWYKSKVIVGAGISIICKLLVMTGIIGDISPGDQDQLANLIVLVAGGIGDILAIGARINQTHAPSITAAQTLYSGQHRSWLGALLLPLALLLASCTGLPGFGWAPPPAPVTQADNTTLDEQAALGVELAYTAANKAAQLAIRTGIVRDPATIRRIGELDNRAFSAVQAARAAYRAGNASNYATAVEQARAAVAAIVSAF